MGKKKEKPINLNELEEEEKMKYEIAEELGLLHRAGNHLLPKRPEGSADW